MGCMDTLPAVYSVVFPLWKSVLLEKVIQGLAPTEKVNRHQYYHHVIASVGNNKAPGFDRLQQLFCLFLLRECYVI